MPWTIIKPLRLCIAHCRRLVVIMLMMVSRFVCRLRLVTMRRISQHCSSSSSMFILQSATFFLD